MTPFMPYEHDRTCSCRISLECMGFSSSLWGGRQVHEELFRGTLDEAAVEFGGRAAKVRVPFCAPEQSATSSQASKHYWEGVGAHNTGRAFKRWEQSPEYAQCLTAANHVICPLQL